MLTTRYETELGIRFPGGLNMRDLVGRVLVAFLLVACSGDPPPNVGAACTDDENCDDGLACAKSIASGYCTAACTTSGSTSQCPEGAICDSVSGAGVTCVKICKTSSDCRSDLDCNGVSSSNIKACKPK